MNFKDIVEFANENQVCYVSTVEGDQPRVRGFLLWFANEEGFYFHTGVNKNVCKQLIENPKIEVCFFDHGEKPAGRMLRVTGKVKFIEDIKLKSRLLEERPFLKQICKGPEDPLLVIFQIYTGEGHFWTMENNLRESEIERIKF